MRHLIAALGAIALLVVGGAEADGQPTVSPVALHGRALVDGSVVTNTNGLANLTVPGADATATATRVASGPARASWAPWWAPVASVLIPGAGQFAMGQQRSVGYLVAEGYLVLQAVAAQREGNRDRNEYRALASDVARRPFSATRPVGAWSYYESMEKFMESGAFDRIPGGAVDPETDATTFNGARWRLARENFWPDPDVPPPVTSSAYQRALASYTAQAVRDEYRWSWRDAQLQKDVYEQTIRSWNRLNKRAVNLVGLVGANHLASLIDAYVTVRVRRFGGVRVAGLELDGFRTSVQLIGDPNNGHRQILSVLRFIPPQN